MSSSITTDSGFASASILGGIVAFQWDVDPKCLSVSILFTRQSIQNLSASVFRVRLIAVSFVHAILYCGDLPIFGKQTVSLRRSVEEYDSGHMPKLWAAEPPRCTFLHELWFSAPRSDCRI